MNKVNKPVKMGPNGRPVRPFVMPESFTGKLMVWRYLLLRRALQLGLLLLFFGTVRWGWKLAGQPVLTGNLSSSEFLVAVIGGRTWCAWVCPINMVTDLASRIRRQLNIKDAFKISRKIRYSVLVLTLVLSILTGVAAFEWVSPIGMLHRELIFGIGAGWIAILGVFLFDLLILKNGWCGHLCPLGAFYAVVGKVAQLRIAFDTPTCTQCCECVKVCPEPQVFNFKAATKTGMIVSGECTNCGRCITVCPEDTLKFDLRQHIKPQQVTETTESQQRRAA